MGENKLPYIGLYLGLTLIFYVSSIKGSALIPGQGPYQPNWESLDSRPLPKWYDEAKIGIFIHWGVFSTPSFGSEWFWWYFNGEKRPEYIDFMNKNYRPGTTYQDFAKDFTAEFYNPDQWAEIFEASGAKYVVLTTKHHEGFTLWPSVNSFSWNAMDLGPKRDLVGALANSIRNKTSLHFGIYHSLFEWFNPIYIRDRESNFIKQDFIRRKTMPELYELVERYKPEVIWSDGEGEAPSKYWNSTHFLTWLYNESPVKDVVVTNDRWGNDTPCKHGGFYSCQDRFNPGKKQNHKWENAMTIDKNSWGFRRNAALKDYLNIEDLITLLAQTVSCGGNLLINVGPTKDGRIEPIFEERLRQLGQWLKVNGEAIYSTEPWSHQNDTITPGIWYTSKPITSNKVGDDKMVVYGIMLSWPKGSNVALGALNNIDPATNIQLLGYPSEKSLSWKKGSLGETIVALPILTPDVLPCNWAWVLKITKD